MYYVSQKPRIVGEFDAEALHARIDHIVDNGIKKASAIQQTLAEQQFGRLVTMPEIAGIQWCGLFNPIGFGSPRNDNEYNDIHPIEPGLRENDVHRFHPDYRPDGKIFKLPEILTGTSRFPTQFLIGRVCLPKDINPWTYSATNFFKSDAGREAVSNALEKGDAWRRSFNPGEILKVPGGVLHRRNIPENAAGYRYLMRLFPKSYLTNASHEVTRLRPFRMGLDSIARARRLYAPPASSDVLQDLHIPG